MLTNYSRFRRGLSACALLLCAAAAFPQNVIQPGDPVIASSSNSPGSEGVANAIDGTEAKYLNRDLANGAKSAGFVVTPSIGVTRVTGISITSGNDAPERDPKTFILEGSNDDSVTNFTSGNWTFIAGVTNAPAFATRLQRKSFQFANLQPYKSYRWTVLETQTVNDCCMQVTEVELLGSTLPPDVTQPGDPVIASSSNSPGSEGVANVIDNTEAKYLNRDLANDAKPAGFIVTPSIGATVVSGITIRSGNDAPERDPKTFILEGSNDSAISDFNSGNWTLIAGVTNAPLFTARLQNKTFLFDNAVPFKSYRWTVLATQSTAAGTANTCCMQVTEVDLLGTGEPANVAQPGDPIIASSSNSPGSEGVANAIDRTEAKYLNRDLANDAKPAGFVVTPSIGETVVTGLAITSGNDAPERDPKTFILEGSNDPTITDFNSGNWSFIAGVTNAPLFTERLQRKAFYFPNATAYKSYRWTVLATQSTAAGTANTCCMQVTEVELLAVTQSNPCDQVAFTEQPVNTPVLLGSSATFFANVNGPWSIQWLKNGVPIPGATQLQYTTPPLTDLASATNLYSVAILGCQTSEVARASIFSPSSSKSIGLNFGGGSGNDTPNGTPTYMLPDDVAGVHPQAYWNNATNINPGSGTGSLGDTSTLPDVLKDSDNQDSTITVDFASSGGWGAGTGKDSSLHRLLNGLIATANSPGNPGHVTFSGVPAGTHSVLVYLVGIPGQIQNGDYWINGETSQTNYVRVMNSDEYKPAPGFYRGTSTDPQVRPLANFIRFDNVKPLGGEGGTIELDFDTATTGGGDRGIPVNAVQLVLNAPPSGQPPQITAHPQGVVAATGGTAHLSVTATGQGLTYQWRKNGKNLPNGGHVSGATTPNLTISSFDESDVGIYSVGVFSQAGDSAISKNAAVNLSNFSIADAEVVYIPFDETSGLTAVNKAPGGKSGIVNGTESWGAGKIGNAFSFDGGTFINVTNYTKPAKLIGASLWVNADPGLSSTVSFVRDAVGDLTAQGTTTGLFDIGLVLNDVDGMLHLRAQLSVGPNIITVTDPAAFSLGTWHQVAFSADGAQLHLYLDGSEVAVADTPLDRLGTPSVEFLTIGGGVTLDTTTGEMLLDANNVFVGKIDDLAIWSRPLTDDEVSAINTAGIQGKALSTVVEEPPIDDTPPELNITTTAGTVTITWTGSGFRLQSSATVNGEFADVSGVTGTSFSTSSATGTQFYRLIK